MKELICQYRQGKFCPATTEDMEAAHDEFKSNQMVRVQTYSIGAQKQRSVTQLGLLFACAELVSENTEDPLLNSKEKVIFASKVAMHYVDENLVVVKKDGSVVFQYRSYSFKALPHMEANRIFDRVFEWMAKQIGVTVDEMVAEAKSRMG